jgi:hypothetical protein
MGSSSVLFQLKEEISSEEIKTMVINDTTVMAPLLMQSNTVVRFSAKDSRLEKLRFSLLISVCVDISYCPVW